MEECKFVDSGHKLCKKISCKYVSQLLYAYNIYNFSRALLLFHGHTFSYFFTCTILSFTGMILEKKSRENLLFHGHFLGFFQLFSRVLFFHGHIFRFFAREGF